MGGYDDELTRPLEGAIEATTSEGPTSPAVGRDEWVARHGDNRSQRGGPLGTIEDRLRRVPWWAWLTLFVAAASLVPVVSDNGYVRRVAFDIPSTCCSRSGSTSSSAGVACSTSASSRSTGSAPTRMRC